MTLSVPRHAVLTGAPGAGKTTLLNAAAAAGYRTSPEVARSILQHPKGMALRRDNPLGFAGAMTEAHINELLEAGRTSELVLFDRGLPDVVGFLDVSGIAVPNSIDSACRSLRYFGPIIRAPAWEDIYERDLERVQTWEEAVESDKAVRAAWIRYGYEVIDLPLASIAERLEFLKAAIQPAA
jgi:predicted ATPase